MVHLPEAFTAYIEANFYGQVTEQSRLEAIVNDDSFLQDPLKHVALFSDHGIVHGRDIAQKIIQVIHHINGVLILQRSGIRLDFMLGYGAMLAYLHDIGMRDFSAFGRAIHPEFAAQLVYTPEFDPLVDLLWQENSGNVAWRLVNLADSGALPQAPQQVFREMLALSMGHSKSKTPITTLNDPQTLRATLQQALSTELHYLYYQQQVSKAAAKLTEAIAQAAAPDSLAPLQNRLATAEADLAAWQAQPQFRAHNPQLQRYYTHFEAESFQWLDGLNPALTPFLQDVIDTVRALRCADALRQRGHTFRTSAGYEVLVNQRTAKAVYALQTVDGSKLFLLEGKDAISSGEANMTSCELDQDRNLRVSFDRGSFVCQEAVDWAVHCAAVVINDIQADVIGSFSRRGSPYPEAPVGKPYEAMAIIVEGVDDNPEFAQAVCQRLGQLNPAIAHRCRPVTSLQKADLQEVERFLQGTPLTWSAAEQDHLLAEMAKSGQKIDHLDREQAFQEVKVITLKAGEVLFEPGSPPGFVYIPLAEGVTSLPEGGYAVAPARPWMAIGNTAVIKGSSRNARVIAEQDTPLLMIPNQIYWRHWHNPYTLKEFVALFGPGDRSPLERRYLLTPMAVQKHHLNKNRRQRYLPLKLRLKTLFQDGDQVQFLIPYLDKLTLAKHQPLFCQGETSDTLYFIDLGQVQLVTQHYGSSETPSQIYGPGDCIGEVEFYTQTGHPATAMATQDSQVYGLTRTALQRMQQEHPAAAIALSQMLLTRIASRLAETRPQPGVEFNSA